MEDRIRNVMAAVFDMPPVNIMDNASPHEIAAWDSLKHMKLMLALEEEFNIRFEDAEIPSLVNFKIITATVKAYVE
jgi:acyl carrier protein